MDYTANVDIEQAANLETIMDAIAPYHGVHTHTTHADTITISFPADSFTQALATAVAVAGTIGRITGITLLSSAEYGRRATSTPIPALLSVTQAAEALNITRPAVQQRIDSGALPATKVGSTWVIPADAVTTN